LTVNSNSNTWITPGIKISSKHKRYFYLLYRTLNDEALKNHFRLYCKTLKDAIREAKRQHYNRQVSNSSNKTRTTWDIVRPVTRKLTSDKTIQELEVNRKVIRKRQNIADFLNSFFLSVVDDNINNNPITNNNPSDYLRQEADHSYPGIKYHPVTTRELAEVSLTCPISCIMIYGCEIKLN
jgi:hypothetical protein